jgi:crossover junction endodeoxyribonuclease RusA
VLPFEFNIIGKPISHQTKDKQRLRDWKGKVRHAAATCWPVTHP